MFLQLVVTLHFLAHFRDVFMLSATHTIQQDWPLEVFMDAGLMVSLDSFTKSCKTKHAEAMLLGYSYQSGPGNQGVKFYETSKLWKLRKIIAGHGFEIYFKLVKLVLKK